MTPQGYRPAACRTLEVAAEKVLGMERLVSLDKFYAVAIGVADEEDAGAAAHGVRLALEVHAPSFFEFFGQRVEVFHGEGDVAVAFTQSVGFLATVVQGQLQARLGIAGHGEESVRRVIADGNLAGELEAQFVGVEVYAAVEVQNSIAGVDVLHDRSSVGCQHATPCGLRLSARRRWRLSARRLADGLSACQ